MKSNVKLFTKVPEAGDTTSSVLFSQSSIKCLRYGFGVNPILGWTTFGFGDDDGDTVTVTLLETKDYVADITTRVFLTRSENIVSMEMHTYVSVGKNSVAKIVVSAVKSPVILNLLLLDKDDVPMSGLISGAKPVHFQVPLKFGQTKFGEIGKQFSQISNRAIGIDLSNVASVSIIIQQGNHRMNVFK